MHADRQPEVASAGRIPPIGWIHTLAIFGGAGVLLFACTHVLIPLFSEATGLEPILFWFLIGGLGVFAPLLVVAWLLLRQERRLGRPHLWSARLRFRRMNRVDWVWGVGALVVIAALSGLIRTALVAWLGGMSASPSFMAFEPVSQGRYWIVAVWVPFWILNIMGEEILWRGAMLPRQEVALANRAWVANASGWFRFHLAFGWQLLLLLLPILIILPYVVQRRQNTWLAVLIHAGLNGPGFIAVALGLVT